jgi:hypothetical protein
MPLPILPAIAIGARGANPGTGPSPGRLGASFGGGGRVLIAGVVVADAGFEGGGFVVWGAGRLGVAFGAEAWVDDGGGALWAPPKSSAQETKSVLTNIILPIATAALRIQLARLGPIVIYPQDYVGTLKLIAKIPLTNS